MLSAEILHVVMALLGIGLGWYVKHQSIGIPQEILDAVRIMLANRQMKQSHGMLKDVLDAYESASSPGAPPHA